ncbi:hypothetical protein BD311DRAFT_450513 [Dichomitus squalens]|uniref:Uncharacterized protein n=1 Tax=Dichomitus squalens TaxID=114155 RepID=A0A4V2JZT9_9APHY|nr:hypothetical protein BD311DRAFT_450513 [Dichomitus squalens]
MQHLLRGRAAGVRGCCWVGAKGEAGKVILYLLCAPISQHSGAWGGAAVLISGRWRCLRRRSVVLDCARAAAAKLLFFSAHLSHPLDWFHTFASAFPLLLAILPCIIIIPPLPPLSFRMPSPRLLMLHRSRWNSFARLFCLLYAFRICCSHTSHFSAMR